MARQAHAAHHIDVKETLPFAVGNILKRHRVENPQVVHQNIDLRTGRSQHGNAFGGR
jgi:hypothetical protein